MSWFKKFLPAFVISVVLIGVGVLTGNIALAGAGFKQFLKVVGIAALLAGISATLEELLTPQQDFEFPGLKQSITYTNEPAHHIVGESRVNGLITDFFEVRNVWRTIGGHTASDKQHSLNCIYTVANHPCERLRAIYLNQQKLNITGDTKTKGKLTFELQRRDDQTDEEYDLLNTQFKDHLEVWINFTGDNSDQGITAGRVNVITAVSFTDPPVISTEGDPVVPVVNNPDFNVSWVLLRFKTDKQVWVNLGGLQVRSANFLIQGSNGNPADAIPAFYNKHLNIAPDLWEGLDEVRTFCSGNNRLINGNYREDQKEQALRAMVTRALDGAVVYEKGKYKIKPSMLTPVTKTIKPEHCIEYVNHQIKQDLQGYGNMAKASYFNKNDDYNNNSTGQVRNSSAITTDGKELNLELGNFRFVNNVVQARNHIVQILARVSQYGRIGLAVAMDDPPEMYERVRVTINEEGIDGIYRVEGLGNSLSGATILSLFKDDDSVYITDEQELQPTQTDYTSVYIPRPPTNITFNEEINVEASKNSIDITCSFTNDARTTSNRVITYINDVESGSFEIFGNSFVLQDMKHTSTLKVRVYGLIGDRRSPDYTENSLVVGTTTPPPDPLNTPELRFNTEDNSLSIRCRTGGNTTTLEVRYDQNTALFTPANIESKQVLATYTCLPSSENNYLADVPNALFGNVRIGIVPISPFGIRGPITQQLVNIQRTFNEVVFEESNGRWSGSVSESVNANGIRTADLIKVQNCLIVAPNYRPDQVTGAQWKSTDPEIVFARRKTGRGFSYFTPRRRIPSDGNTYNNHVIEVSVDISDLLDKSFRLDEFTVTLRYWTTDGGTPTSVDFNSTASNDVVRFVLTGVTIFEWITILRFPDNDDHSLFVCSMQSRALHRV